MATYTGQLRLSNGQIVTCCFASSVAVGVYLPVDTNGAAGTASPTFFWVASQCDLVDLTTDETAGLAEFISDGRRTGKMITTTATYAATNAGRPTGREAYGVTFVPGRNYQLIMNVAGAA